MNTAIIAKVSIHIDAPVATVWKAVTDPGLVKQYFFNTDLVTNWKVGNPIYFRGEWDGQAYEDKGTVLAFEPQKMLQYDYLSSWSDKPDLPENYQTITYELTPKDNGTLLSITQNNVDSEAQKEHSEHNWEMVLGEMKKMLEA